jgi:hypothetical protein
MGRRGVDPIGDVELIAGLTGRKDLRPVLRAVRAGVGIAGVVRGRPERADVDVGASDATVVVDRIALVVERLAHRVAIGDDATAVVPGDQVLLARQEAADGDGGRIAAIALQLDAAAELGGLRLGEPVRQRLCAAPIHADEIALDLEVADRRAGSERAPDADADTVVARDHVARRQGRAAYAYIDARADDDAAPIRADAVRDRLGAAGIGADQIALDDGCARGQHASPAVAGQQIALPRQLPADPAGGESAAHGAAAVARSRARYGGSVGCGADEVAVDAQLGGIGTAGTADDRVVETVHGQPLQRERRAASVQPESCTGTVDLDGEQRIQPALIGRTRVVQAARLAVAIDGQASGHPRQLGGEHDGVHARTGNRECDHVLTRCRIGIEDGLAQRARAAVGGGRDGEGHGLRRSRGQQSAGEGHRCATHDGCSRFRVIPQHRRRPPRCPCHDGRSRRTGTAR